MTVQVRGEIRATMRIQDAPAHVVDRFTDFLMEALLANPALEDPGISASLANGEVLVQFTASAESLQQLEAVGPRYLHDAVISAGRRPVDARVDGPGVHGAARLRHQDVAVHDMVGAQAARMVTSVSVIHAP